LIVNYNLPREDGEKKFDSISIFAVCREQNIKFKFIFAGEHITKDSPIPAATSDLEVSQSKLQ
jgi:hypothetical protein